LAGGGAAGGGGGENTCRCVGIHRKMVPVLTKSTRQVVDLSCNLLSTLASVAVFLAAAPPCLTSLNVSDNRLAMDTAQPSARPTCNLQTLVMNNMEDCTWDLVFELVEAAGADHLKELSLADNGLATVPGELGTRVGKIETLRLDGNCMASWGSLAALAGLPALTRLTLNRNPLQGSWCDVDGQGAVETQHAASGGFTCLRSLSLNATCISSWEQIDALAMLPALRDIRLQEIELTQSLGDDEKRMLVIAHLPNVSSGGKGRQTVGSETCGLLNGSMVTANERRDAHRYFLEYWSKTPPERRPGRYAALLAADPLARRLAGDVGDEEAARVEGPGDGDEAGTGVGEGAEKGVLHDGVTASSFSARGLGRCE